MIRGMALICIACSCTVIGFLRGQRYSARVRQLREIRRMVTLLHGELRYGRAPMPELFQKTADRLAYPFNMFLQSMARKLKGAEGKNFYEIFSSQLREFLKNTDLQEEDLKELEQLGAILGRLDRDTQLKTLELYRQEVDVKIAELKENLPGQLKLYRSLGIMAGLFLIILLM